MFQKRLEKVGARCMLWGSIADDLICREQAFALGAGAEELYKRKKSVETSLHYNGERSVTKPPLQGNWGRPMVISSGPTRTVNQHVPKASRKG